jgi:hypothetical protein
VNLLPENSLIPAEAEARGYLRGTMEEQHGHIGGTRTHHHLDHAPCAHGATITVAGMRLGSSAPYRAHHRVDQGKPRTVVLHAPQVRETIFQVPALVPITTLTFTIGLTFLDIWYR